MSKTLALKIAITSIAFYFLYRVSQANYLVFHTGIELFSIVIAFSITVIAINTHKYSRNSFFMYLGIAYFFIGLIDLLHTLAFNGMGVFPGNTANMATQLWIAARYMESITILLSTLYLTRKLNIKVVVLGYSLTTILIILSIFHWGNFPACWTEAQGLTPFKIYSEYIISGFMVIAVLQLYRLRKHFDDVSFKNLVFAYSITVATELMFTQYFGVYDITNMLGHLLKTLSFYFIYKALVEVNLNGPYQQLAEANRRLQSEMLQRETAENQRRLYEQEINKISRLDSIGTLAAGLAHDFKNLLMIILGNVSLSELKTEADSPIVPYLNHIKDAANHATSLTNELLTFSKGGSPVKETQDISSVVQDTVELALSGSKLKAEFDFPLDNFLVDIDPSQIRQVINNLVINAVQAMPDGGKLVVSNNPTSVTVDNTNYPLAPGEYITISITDQGSGIPESDLDKIFDPFYSTKEQGYGLGLTTSFSIIKNHGGYLAVKSKLGVGTTFTIYLPKSLNTPTSEASHGNNIIYAGSGTILIMDDDEIILKTLADMLSNLGYDVEKAKNGVQAIEIYKSYLKYNKNISAAILDVTVPNGMGGEEAASHILDMDKSANLIISTGYANSKVLSEYKKFGFKACLVKPYYLTTLSKTLEGILTASVPEVAATKDH